MLRVPASASINSDIDTNMVLAPVPYSRQSRCIAALGNNPHIVSAQQQKLDPPQQSSQWYCRSHKGSHYSRPGAQAPAQCSSCCSPLCRHTPHSSQCDSSGHCHRTLCRLPSHPPTLDRQTESKRGIIFMFHADYCAVLQATAAGLCAGLPITQLPWTDRRNLYGVPFSCSMQFTVRFFRPLPQDSVQVSRSATYIGQTDRN